MKTATQSHDAFIAGMKQFIADFKESAIRQYEYNLKTNIPNNIAGVTLDNAGEQAIECGLVSAISKMHEWGIDETVRFAHHILEDVNAHTEAKALVPFIPEYQ